MPQVGDRVIVAGQKLGAPTREGTLLAKLGSMIRVRWADGTESLFTPGAGSVEYQPGTKAAGRKTGSNGKAAKTTKAPAKKVAAKKGAAKKTASKSKRA